MAQLHAPDHIGDQTEGAIARSISCRRLTVAQLHAPDHIEDQTEGAIARATSCRRQRSCGTFQTERRPSAS